MQIDRFDHIGLTVPSIEDAIEFYCGALGCSLLEKFEPGTNPDVRRLVGVADADLRGAMVRTPGGDSIELVEYRHPRLPKAVMETTTPSAVHVALRVDSIDDVLQRICKAGATAVSAPVQLGVGRFVYCRDPFGIMLELVDLPATNSN